MSTGFLAGLAARGGPVTGASLRPDPWRGRFFLDSAAPESAAVPAPSANEANAVTQTVVVAAPAPAPPQVGPVVTPVVVPRAAAVLSVSPPQVEGPEPVRQPEAPPVPPRALPDPPKQDRPAAPPLIVMAPREVVVTPRPAETVAEPRPTTETQARPPSFLQPRLREPVPPAAPDENQIEKNAIEISIGRIEWRAAAATPAPVRPPAPPAETGFAEYRALRAGLDRGRR